jgi:hypothetical protein
VQVTPQSTRRRIPLSRRSHIIGFQPLITGTPVHESALERNFVTLTGFMHPRAVITSQPVTIVFLDGFQRRRYTPDYLIQCSGELAAELIEVKYARDLRENWARLEPAFKAARRWANDVHATFRVLTESDIRGPVLHNAKRLLPLRSAPLDRKMVMLTLTVTQSLQQPTFGSILAALPDRALALATLWRLIARGTLQVDLSRAITLASDIRVV